MSARVLNGLYYLAAGFGLSFLVIVAASFVFGVAEVNPTGAPALRDQFAN